MKKLFILHSDEEVMKYIRTPDQSLADTQRTIEKQMGVRKVNPLLGIYCAHLKSSNEFMGWGYLNHLDFNQNDPIELGYRLHKKYWGSGFATEIAKTLSDHFFSFENSSILCAVTKQEHEASKKVLIKIGFKYMGLKYCYESENSYFEKTVS